MHETAQRKTETERQTLRTKLPGHTNKIPTPLTGQPLSEREREIARLVAQGLPNKQIARQLGISVYTIKNHMQRIMEKTGAPNRVAVAVWIMQQ
jgi:DNA-binding NarL/FixJ family response regulator